MTSYNQFDLFRDSIPKHPYCSDVKNYMQIKPALVALQKKYIQPNSNTDLKWLIYDVDRPSSPYDWYDLKAPRPNIVATNKENGHSHLWYGLGVPVFKQPEAHRKPLRYAAAIDVALTELLDADVGYTKFISKNPLNSYWEVNVWEDRPYDLDWLADYVDLKPYTDTRKNLPNIGFGRNCNLFEQTRFWAYRQIRKSQNWLSCDFFVQAVIEWASGYNLSFIAPLPFQEVKSIGKSIGKWVYKNMSYEGFKNWGDNRRNKSIIVRQDSAEEKIMLLRQYKELNPLVTVRELADLYEVSLGTVSKAIEFDNTKTISALKPWEVEGISRPTWYRRNKS